MPLGSGRDTAGRGGGGASGGTSAGRSAIYVGGKCGGTHMKDEHVKDATLGDT